VPTNDPTPGELADFCDRLAQEPDWKDFAAYRDEFRRIAALLRSMPTWQPIETAPKDGTTILISWAGAGMVFLSRWLKNADEWLMPVTTAHRPLKPPTHFCRYPSPPEIPR